jgi:pimeloyl-ACP methyl ester carboxylesterase
MAVGGLTGRRLPALVAVLLAAAGCGLVGRDGVTRAQGGGSRLAALTAVQPVTVDGHRVATRCAGSAKNPTVLLVSGYDSPVSSWDEVQQRLSATTRVCAYDRLGVGHSDPAPRRQTVVDLARELDAVMSALGLRRPVVLVAQDIGGVIATTWAEAHDDDLAGLVLVDATPPGYVHTALQLVPPTATGSAATLRADLERLLSPGDNAEHLAAGPALAAAGSFPVLGAVPLVVLARSVSDYGDLRPQVAAALDSAWTGGQQQWTELSSLGRMQTVVRAGHEIQRDQPGSVVDAVREVVGAGT